MIVPQSADAWLELADTRLREIEPLLATKRAELLLGTAELRDVLELQAERWLLREFKTDAGHLREAAERLSARESSVQA